MRVLANTTPCQTVLNCLGSLTRQGLFPVVLRLLGYSGPLEGGKLDEATGIVRKAQNLTEAAIKVPLGLLARPGLRPSRFRGRLNLSAGKPSSMQAEIGDGRTNPKSTCLMADLPTTSVHLSEQGKCQTTNHSCQEQAETVNLTEIGG